MHLVLSSLHAVEKMLSSAEILAIGFHVWEESYVKETVMHSVSEIRLAALDLTQQVNKDSFPMKYLFH